MEGDKDKLEAYLLLNKQRGLFELLRLSDSNLVRFDMPDFQPREHHFICSDGKWTLLSMHSSQMVKLVNFSKLKALQFKASIYHNDVEISPCEIVAGTFEGNRVFLFDKIPGPGGFLDMYLWVGSYKKRGATQFVSWARFSLTTVSIPYGPVFSVASQRIYWVDKSGNAHSFHLQHRRQTYFPVPQDDPHHGGLHRASLVVVKGRVFLILLPTIGAAPITTIYQLNDDGAEPDLGTMYNVSLPGFDMHDGSLFIGARARQHGIFVDNIALDQQSLKHKFWVGPSPLAPDDCSCFSFQTSQWEVTKPCSHHYCEGAFLLSDQDDLMDTIQQCRPFRILTAYSEADVDRQQQQQNVEGGG